MSEPLHLRIVRVLVRHRVLLICGAVIVAMLASLTAGKVVMVRRIEGMFSSDDPLLLPYQHMKQVFGGNDIVLAVYDDDQLLDPSGVGLARLKALREELAAAPGVKGVLSLDLPIGDKILSDTTSIPEKVRKLFEGYTHSTDGKSASVACMLYPLQDTDVTRAESIEAIRAIMAKPREGIRPGFVTGEPVLIHDAFNFVESDGQLLLTVTTSLLSIAILIFFRNPRWVIIPLAVVQLALLMTNGFFGALGYQLNMVGSMLRSVVTVIGIAAVIHIVVRFRALRDAGLAPQAALRVTGNRLAVPIFWASVTDAVGFAALMFAKVGLVADFGLMMAMGSMMVMLALALLVPALVLCGPGALLLISVALLVPLFLVFGKIVLVGWGMLVLLMVLLGVATDPRPIWGERWVQERLLEVAQLVNRHPLRVGLITLIVSGITIAGIGRLRIESDFTRNFRDTTPIVQAYEMVESRMGGAGVCDVVIPAPEHLTWDYLYRVLKLEHRLRKEVKVGEGNDAQPGLTKVLSLADAILGVAPTNLFRVGARVRQPMITTGLRAMRSRIPDFYDALSGTDPNDSDQHYFRVMLRAKERQPSHQKKQIIDQVRQITHEEFPEAEVTGYFILLTSLIESMLRDQWTTFAIAAAGILLTMVVAFRSVKLALIATLPNIIPILMVNGLMGWLNYPVNMGAAMIAAVSLGLSIDGSVHYLYGYKRQRRLGKTVDEALANVQKSVGQAMLLSTLALVIGFSSLAVSQFVPTIYFGSLVSASMLGSLFGNLLWLPLLLRLFDHKPGTREQARTAKRLEFASAS
ncbi:MAG: MMPL family transporter [Planctomycetota bacterium]